MNKAQVGGREMLPPVPRMGTTSMMVMAILVVMEHAKGRIWFSVLSASVSRYLTHTRNSINICWMTEVAGETRMGWVTDCIRQESIVKDGGKFESGS